MADNEKTPMSIEAASKWSGYSKPYLYKLIHEGKIPYYKPDSSRQGKVILCKEELAAFIFGKRIATKKEIAEQAEQVG
ncbi:MAG: helix-turn-helix domain-containing protein [Treponema sp.]|nr:helix-turn-helix domain-containing protein [Treponema sp.]